MGRGDTQNMLSAGSLLPVPCAHSLSSAPQAWTTHNAWEFGEIQRQRMRSMLLTL